MYANMENSNPCRDIGLLHNL